METEILVIRQVHVHQVRVGQQIVTYPAAQTTSKKIQIIQFSIYIIYTDEYSCICSYPCVCNVQLRMESSVYSSGDYLCGGKLT